MCGVEIHVRCTTADRIPSSIITKRSVHSYTFISVGRVARCTLNSQLFVLAPYVLCTHRILPFPSFFFIYFHAMHTRPHSRPPPPPCPPSNRLSHSPHLPPPPHSTLTTPHYHHHSPALLCLHPPPSFQ